jgi:ABC-2 type transport system permease protein
LGGFQNKLGKGIGIPDEFFLGRLRSIIVLLLLYYVWFALTKNSGRFAGYDAEEIFTYVLGVNILRSIVFGSQSRQVASEINDGWFSKYLIMPINHFWYEFFRQLAERGINLLSSLVEVAIFVAVLKPELYLQRNMPLLIVFIIAVVLAVFLYYVLNYLVSLFAFWSREAMGPKFLFEWILEFASGAYFPLDILSRAVFIVFVFFPFAYLIYFPIIVYLGRCDFWQILTGICLQIAFIIIFGVLARIAWKSGLKRYSGEGM